MTSNELVRTIAIRTGIGQQDVQRVLSALGDLLVDLVGLGVVVRLGHLGCFRIGSIGRKRLNGSLFGPFKTILLSATPRVRDRITEIDAMTRRE